ncbi:hypothetical protein [Haliangium sp.]|uniref:hypothetical protein n=1 Tax=Haliangium sp. TaxID=2663208 RepID=UPI003D13B557
MLSHAERHGLDASTAIAAARANHDTIAPSRKAQAPDELGGDVFEVEESLGDDDVLGVEPCSCSLDIRRVASIDQWMASDSGLIVFRRFAFSARAPPAA